MSGNERMPKPRVGRDPSGDGDRPVDSGRDDPVDLLGASELADRRFVLDGDDRAAVRVLEAEGGRVPVASDDVEAALPCRPVQPKLTGTGAED